MSEVNVTTRDEYGLKAGGILAALEKFSTLFGLRLGFLLFATAEEVSKGLQAKDTTLQQAFDRSGIIILQETEDRASIQAIFQGHCYKGSRSPNRYA